MEEKNRFRPAPPQLRSFRPVGRETVHTFRVFGVERQLLVPPWAETPQPFYTLACNDFATVIALTDDDQLVLVWQYRFGTNAMSLEAPGGIVDRGESPEEAAKRELLEETGFTARSWERLATFEANPAIQGNLCHVFLAEGAAHTRAPCFDDTEECEVTLVPARHIEDLLEDGHIRHAIIAAALGAYLRRRRRLAGDGHSAPNPR